MLKRKMYLDKKIIKYRLWFSGCLQRTLIKSIKTNHHVYPLHRLSFFINKDRQTNHCMFYASQNKLQCFMSYSMRVPSKKLNLSRFYLSRGADRLFLSNYQK